MSFLDENISLCILIQSQALSNQLNTRKTSPFYHIPILSFYHSSPHSIILSFYHSIISSLPSPFAANIPPLIANSCRKR